MTFKYNSWSCNYAPAISLMLLVWLVGLALPIFADREIGTEWRKVEETYSKNLTIPSRYGYTSLVFKDQLWFIGGKNEYRSYLSDVYTSGPDVDWQPTTLFAEFGKIFGHSSFVLNNKIWVVGGFIDDSRVESSSIWSSTDGKKWILENENPSFGAISGHKSFIFNNKAWVIGSSSNEEPNNNHVWSSTDGINWNLESSNVPFSEYYGFATAVFNNQIWVVGGEKENSNEVAKGWSSSDGIVWQEHSLITSTPLYANLHSLVVFKDKMWIHCGNSDYQNTNQIWSSEDGVNWVKETKVGSLPNAYYFNCIEYSDKLWFTYAGDIYQSPDGTSWSRLEYPKEEKTPEIFSARESHTCVEFNNKLFLIGGNGEYLYGDIWTSNDGVKWDRNLTSYVSSRKGHTSTVFQNKIWIIGGTTYNYLTLSSEDGDNWEYYLTTPSAFNYRTHHTTTVFKNKLWVIGGTSGTNLNEDIWSSEDGINWTQEVVNAAFGKRSDHTCVVFLDKMWIIGGSTANDVWSSENGIDWVLESSTLPFKRSGHTCVVMNDRLWVIGGKYTGEVWSSADGVLWTKEFQNDTFLYVENPTANYFQNKLIVIGGKALHHFSNEVVSSEDGKNWTVEVENSGPPIRKNFSTVYFQDKFWIIGGISPDGRYLNDVWNSDDGINWKVVTRYAHFNPRAEHSSIVFKDKIWVIEGKNSTTYFAGVWSSPDGKNWTIENGYERNGGYAGVSAVVHNNELYILGGYNLQQYCFGACEYRLFDTNSVWKSSDGKEWQLLPRQNPFRARHNAKVISFNDKLWMIGGFTQPVYYGSTPGPYYTLMSSVEGTDWVPITLDLENTPQNILPVIFDDSLYLFQNNSYYSHLPSYALKSKDGINWNKYQTSISDQLGIEPNSIFAKDDELFVLSHYNYNIQFWKSGAGLTLEATPNPLDYGYQLLSTQEPIVRNVTLENPYPESWEHVTISSVSLQNNGSGAFSFEDEPTTGTLLMGQNVDFRVQYQPQQEGVDTAELVIQTTNIDYPFFTIPISARAVEVIPESSLWMFVGGEPETTY